MGAADSKQKLGERVLAARKKLDEDRKMQSDRYQHLQSKSPKTMKFAIQNIDESFKSCSPFLEPVLLLAWLHHPDQCQKIILAACKKVLSAPIIRAEYEWFTQNVFPSSVWFFETTQNRFMFEELMDIADTMSKDIINTMDSIYNHLTKHPKWQTLMNIKNSTIVLRQDHPKVALLQQSGIRDIAECKEKDEISEEIQAFIDFNFAINVLTTTAKNINEEFQNHIKTVMSHYGDFKAGPTKKVERCLSKLENDYQDAVYPKAAKLLDLVRCSVTFNTLEQLIAGCEALMKHMKSHPSIMELARIKNGFLDADYEGGYRDIKMNVIYHSQLTDGVNMVCEVQLILGQYLHEKKRIHKLYSVVRQQLYFKMVVQADTNAKAAQAMNNLKFVPVLDVHTDIPKLQLYNTQLNKCSVDSSLGLLGIEAGPERFVCIDIDRKQLIFEIDLEINDYIGRHSHHWITIDEKKYLSIQTAKNVIKMFEVKAGSTHRYGFEENEKLRICLNKSDTINCCEFDRKFENIIIIRNGVFLEKRSIRNVNSKKKKVTKIELNQRIQQSDTKMLSLSNNGQFCVLGTGGDCRFFLIDIMKKKTYRLESKVLSSTQSPCFVNGEALYVAVGAENSQIEIWNIQRKEPIKVLKLENIRKAIMGGYGIDCMYSTNNILAVGSQDNMLRLWNVTNWKIFHTAQYNFVPNSLHLTEDSKYLTVGGSGRGGSGQCIVMRIETQ